MTKIVLVNGRDAMFSLPDVLTMKFLTLTSEMINTRLIREIAHLLTQLRDQPSEVSDGWLRELIAFPKTWFFVAQNADGQTVGMLSLSAFPRLSGWTESVVVDAAWRQQGIATALLTAAIKLAESEGFATVSLSSRPHWVEANRLYERLGFALVPTNFRRRSMLV
jgi:ribosomal protein S18 acetylase RimI-like enzyme